MYHTGCYRLLNKQLLKRGAVHQRHAVEKPLHVRVGVVVVGSVQVLIGNFRYWSSLPSPTTVGTSLLYIAVTEPKNNRRVVPIII